MGSRRFLFLSVLICASCVLEQQAVDPGRSLAGGAGGDGGQSGSAGSAGGSAGTAGAGGGGGSEFGKWSRRTCETCVSDENCWNSDHRCVPMFFNSERFPDDDTGFCLPEAQREFVGAPYDCNGEEPYVLVLHERVSMSGVGGSAYCGPREDVTTCYAVLAQQGLLECLEGRDDQCPTGGLCRYVQDNGKWDYRCTYACTSNSECRNKQGWEIDCGGYCGS